MELSICPRCEERAFEYLETYGYCIGCNYSPEVDAKPVEIIPRWALDALKEADAEAENESEDEKEYLETA